MCAKFEHGNHCAGDSGGPLMVNSADSGCEGMAQIGIASYATPCNSAVSGTGAYTRISEYYDWIQTTIGEDLPSSSNGEL